MRQSVPIDPAGIFLILCAMGWPIRRTCQEIGIR